MRPASGHRGRGLLRAHPGDNTEADLVDHVGDVVEDTHDFLAAEVVGVLVEEVANRVDDPADQDEGAQSVGAPLQFFLDLRVVNAESGKEAEGEAGRDHDHRPAHATEEESNGWVHEGGFTEVAEADHDDGTHEADAREAKASEGLVRDGVLAHEGRELEGHQGDGDDPVHVAVFGADNLVVNIHATHVVVVEGCDTNDERRDGHRGAVLGGNVVALAHEEHEGGAHRDVPHEEQEEGQQLKGVVAVSVAQEGGEASVVVNARVRGDHGGNEDSHHGHGGQ